MTEPTDRVDSFGVAPGEAVEPPVAKTPDERTPGRILIVDDEPRACSALKGLLRKEGYEVATAGNAFQGLELLGRVRPDVVLTDLRMPGLDGLAFLEKIRAASPSTRIVVMTAYGSIDAAVDAIKKGADDFIEKPIDLQALCCTLQRSMEHASLRNGSEPSSKLEAGTAASLGVVGNHPSMQTVLERAEQVARSRATVLLTGESGTGKGLLAETIHRISDRAEAPFVELSCAALSESLLESELFGHERGAFTGAVRRHEGKFMSAKGGTLFLDEIGSCPPATQVKLLRFLQTRRFERVGGDETLSVDVRLIAATNEDLPTEMAEGRFREDLFYRLDVFRIELPPLRARRSDIPALAEGFLACFAKENDRRIEGFAQEALDRLLLYDWPGNVRELEHAMEHAAIVAKGPEVTVHDLPKSVVEAPEDPLDVAIPGSTLAEIERAAILKSVMAAGGSATEAAAMLGISKSKVYYRLRDYGSESSGGDGATTDDAATNGAVMAADKTRNGDG